MRYAPVCWGIGPSTEDMMAKTQDSLRILLKEAEAAEQEFKTSSSAAEAAEQQLKRARQAFKKAKKAHRKAAKSVKKAEEATRDARKALEKAQLRAKKRATDKAGPRKDAAKLRRQAKIHTPAPRKTKRQPEPRRRPRSHRMAPIGGQATLGADSFESREPETFEISERDLT